MTETETLLIQSLVFFGSYAATMLIIAYVGYYKGWWK